MTTKTTGPKTAKQTKPESKQSPTTKADKPNQNYAGRPDRGAPNRNGRSAVAVALAALSTGKHVKVAAVAKQLAKEFPGYGDAKCLARVRKLLSAVRSGKESNRQGLKVLEDKQGRVRIAKATATKAS